MIGQKKTSIGGRGFFFAKDLILDHRNLLNYLILNITN